MATPYSESNFSYAEDSPPSGMSEVHDLLAEELYRARKNVVLHLSGRVHRKYYGRTPNPINCDKCLRTLQRVAEAEQAIERQGATGE
jgi:hypothetical protein